MAEHACQSSSDHMHEMSDDVIMNRVDLEARQYSKLDNLHSYFPLAIGSSTCGNDIGLPTPSPDVTRTDYRSCSLYIPVCTRNDVSGLKNP